MTNPTIVLTGASKTQRTFTIYPLNQAFSAVGGVYVVTKAIPNTDGSVTHQILYVGQTGNLSERFDAHHKSEAWCARKANRICVIGVGDEATRLAIEADLVKAYNPPCNG